MILDLQEYLKEYPLVAGAVGVWALSTGTYALKSIPTKIWGLLTRITTTKLTLTSTHLSYHYFLQWYNENLPHKNARSLKISNGLYGSGGNIKSLGYGNHYYLYKWTPLRINLFQATTGATNMERDCVEITILGRSHKLFDEIAMEIDERNFDKGKTVIYKFRHEWERVSEQRIRNLQTLYLNKGVKEELTNFTDNFKGREEFNLKHGLNHQTALLLYGPPGTGKTSIIRAIAERYNSPIYNMDSSAIGKIEDAFSTLPENAIIVIEDMDRDPALVKEEGGKPAFSLTNLGDTLNVIDGLHTIHGRILIATTNHIEKLDPALIRDGRFDLRLKIDYVDMFALQSFVEKFYPDHSLPKDFELKVETTMATIQTKAIENLDNFGKFLIEISKGT